MNPIAHGALLLWPIVTLVLFLSLSHIRAITISLLAGYMFLPVSVGFDFKAIPTLNKTSIPNLSAFVIALAMAPAGQFRWPRSFVVNLMMLGFVFGPIFTGMTNPDPIVIGSVYLPPMDLYTSLSMTAEQAIALMPFILGAGLLRTERAHRDILVIFASAGLIYSAPVLLEIAKGPFLQVMIFKVDPGGFYGQQIRDGGFRAMAFLGHGLLVSTFIGMTVIAAIGLWRSRIRINGMSAAGIAVYLGIVLILNKSMGAVVIILLMVPLLLFLTPRRFLTVALLLAMTLVTYPVLRANHLVPVERIQAMASSFSEGRGDSLEYRLKNEELLLRRASERPWFGWGGFSRNHVFQVQFWGGTSNLTVTDGTWILVMGGFGWLGYLSTFGLLCYPFWHMFRIRKQAIPAVSAAVAAMLLYNLLDLIPNSSLRPVTWLLAGALAGLVVARQAKQAPKPLTGLTGFPGAGPKLTPSST